MRKVVIPAAALLAVALVFSAAFAADDKADKAAPAAAKSADGAQVGDVAPEFSLKDQDGKTVDLASLKGKTVVLEWFNQQCPYVVKHYKTTKTMNTTAEKYKDKDVVWLAINTTGKSAEENKETAQAWGINHPILNDTTTSVAQAYGAKTTPHMYVIDKEGKLVYKGAIDDDPSDSAAKGDKAVNYVAKALDEVLAGKPVSTTETKAYGCGVKYKKGDS
ncbi:MAG: thioredoxin family protein [Tepidisphaeraceae bacterium]